MDILITGGAGFIGICLAKRLVESGHSVLIVDCLSTQIHGHIPNVVLPDGVRFQRGDIRDRELLIEAVSTADVVYHLASETGTGQSMYDIRHYVEVNDIGTATLLEAMAASKSKRRKLILSSSRSVYGEGAYKSRHDDTVVSVPPRSYSQLNQEKWDLFTTEDDSLIPIATHESFPLRPASVYAATKVSQEFMCASASDYVNAETICLRFQNVFGEGQSLQNPYTGIISIFYNKARQGLEIPIYEDGKESRDFIHVEDVVSALVSCLDVRLLSGTVLNVGSGVPTTVLELAQTLVDVSGFDVPIKITGEFRVGDIRHCYANIDKMKELLGIVPKISLADGLERFCSWASCQGAFEDLSTMAAKELRERGLS